jgi:NAD(P)H-dependent FMN reductase
MPKILVIVGTTRQGRSGRKVADWYIAEAKKSAPQVEFELLDVADLDLPLFNEVTPPLYHQYSDVQNKLAETIGSADGYVFVTSEYNHSVPASLKNLIDYISAEWNHKVAAYVGYGAVGAIRAIEHLVQIMAEMRVASTKDHVTINAIWEALDENGVPKPGYQFGDIAAQVTELVWWADALKAAR